MKQPVIIGVILTTAMLTATGGRVQESPRSGFYEMQRQQQELMREQENQPRQQQMIEQQERLLRQQQEMLERIERQNRQRQYEQLWRPR